MKIRTDRKAYFGRQKQYENIIVNFDSFGVAEIENDKDAEHLLKVYSHCIFRNNDEKFNTKKTYLEEKNVENSVKLLQSEIDSKTTEIESLKGTILSLEKDLTEWKKLYDSTKLIADESTKELKGYKDAKEYEVENLQFKISLLEKNKEELIVLCDTLKISKTKYEGKKKEDIIKVILIESGK